MSKHGDQCSKYEESKSKSYYMVRGLRQIVDGFILYKIVLKL